MNNLVEAIVGIVFGFIITVVALFSGADLEVTLLGVALFVFSVVALCFSLGFFKTKKKTVVTKPAEQAKKTATKAKK